MKLEKYRSRIASALVLVLVGSGAWACKRSSAGDVAPAASASEMAPARKAASSGPGGGETPEAVVDRMKKAAADKNMPELVACLAPKARQEMSAAMYLGATMMVAFSQMGAEMGGAMMEGMSGMAEGMGGQPPSAEDRKKAEEQAAKMKEELGKMNERYNALMAKHGLPTLPKEGEPEPAELSKEELDKTFTSIDHGAFIADVLALLESMPGEKSEASEEGPFDLQQGALENLKIDGDKATGTIGGDPISFVKIDGRWFLEGDPMGMGGPGAPEAVAP